MLKNLALLGASVLISLVLAEGLVRLVAPQQPAVWHTMRDGLVVHPPGLTTYLTEFDQETRFNSAGMRDRERAVSKAEGTLRVLVLGDSFMEALQVAFQDSFPSLLESALRDKLGREVEVINLAVSGWSQDDQLAYLRKHGLGYRPDLVLVAMTVHNDVVENERERFHALSGGRLVTKPVVLMSETEYRILQLKGFFASHSHLWQLLRKLKHLAAIRMQAAELDKHVAQLITTDLRETQTDHGWALTFSLFKAIRDAGREVGATTAIMLIPLRIQLHDEALKGFRTKVGAPASGVAADAPQQAMARFGRESGIEIIDLLPALRSWTVGQRAVDPSASVHLQEGHWNAAGHRLAANVAAEAIVAKRLLAR